MGYCSRSQAAALVRAGRVTLNGQTVRDPETPARVGLDQIVVDGSTVRERAKIYLVLNKPRGVVTTASDEKGRATVYDLLPPGEWVGPVGRLDKASEGLLLLTNDSEWAAKITDPASHLDKRYHVQVDRVAGDDLPARLQRGITVDGEDLRAKAALVLRVGGKNSWLEVTLDEGKNRQIRRMLVALGVKVLRLVRVSLGPLELGNLKKGTVRRLTDGEKRLLDRALEGAAG
jgi:23S rRNA pseudouridine2605 synthase